MKANRWLIGLGIASVVIAIWAALKNTGVGTSVVVQASPSIQPTYGVQGITPLGAPQVTVNPGDVASATPVQAQVPGTSASGVPNYTAQTQLTAGGAPIPGPTPGAMGTPRFYGPIQQFLASMIPQSDASTPAPKPAGDCGCGGNCAGSCKDPCGQTNSRFPDGRGACLAFNRRTQIAAANPAVWLSASNNLKSANIDTFDVFQQTVFDYESKRGDMPASPFLSPV